MRETRQRLKQRLQAAGRWHEYLAEREQLVEEGLTPAQAREEALRRIESRDAKPEDPPNPSAATQGATPAAPSEPETLFLPDFSRRVPSHEAAQWVSENLANPKVKPDDAPNGLAWGLLAWVRRSPTNETTFWTSIWPKLLPSGAALKRQGDVADGFDPDPDKTERTTALIDKVLADWQAGKRD